MCSCEDAGSVMPNNSPQVQAGFLLHFKDESNSKWFGPNWSRVFCVLYADSTLLWYDSQMAARPQGSVYLKVAPELIATGQVARRLFHVPNPPSSAASAYEHVIAIGERRRQRVHFFLADDQHALSAWLSAIVSTLPVATAPPPLPAPPGPSAPFYVGAPSAYQAAPVYAIHQPQPAPVTSTVVMRDAGPSYGDVAVGMAAGAVMGAALSGLNRPAYGYYAAPGWPGGPCHQDNDVTVVNNYNVEFNNVDYNAPAGNSFADWNAYADDAGFDL